MMFGDESGLDIGKLTTMFESEGINFTQSLVSKIKDACKLFRCNHCRAHYDSMRELSDHLKGDRSHIVNTSVINVRKLALMERVYGRAATLEEQKRFSLDFERLSPAQKRTLIEIAIDRAYFEKVRRFL